MRKQLRDKRLEKGMTQKEIARKVGIARTTYTNIEMGNKSPSFKVAVKLKKVIGTDSDDIFLCK